MDPWMQMQQRFEPSLSGIQSTAYHGMPTTVLQQTGNLNQSKQLKFQPQQSVQSEQLQCRPQVQLPRNGIEQQQQHQLQQQVVNLEQHQPQNHLLQQQLQQQTLQQQAVHQQLQNAINEQQQSNAFTNSHHLLRLFNDTPCISRSVGNSTARQFDFTPLCLQQPLRIKEKPVRKFSGSSRSLVMASVSQAPQSLAPDNMDEETKLWQQVQSHQKTAARLPAVEEIRTLLDSSLRGMLSTFSQHYEGYPSGSMVDICCGEDGCPILAISSLAVHTKDLLANPKCSLLVNKDPTDRTELVITVHGDAVFVPENEREASRASYLRKHPEAFWVDFGDFQFVRIEPKCVRYVSGVATAMLGSGEFTGEEYKKAKVDPISQFSIPVASHMNRDHAEDTKLIVQHFVSIKVDHAQIIDLDRLGFNVKVGYEGKTLKLRIPFPRPAEDRRDVKTLIVQMLEAAKQDSIDSNS